MKPMIGSPGIGRQQCANCTAMPSVPRMMIEPGRLRVGRRRARRSRSSCARHHRRRGACPGRCRRAAPRATCAPASRTSLLPALGVDLAGVATRALRSAWLEQPLAQRRRLLELHGLEEVADVRARLAGAHVREPGRVGLGVRGGDDLDAVAVAQLGAQRHQLAVDLGRDAAVADVGVHRVGEVDRGRAARQRQDLALGREDVDLVGEEVDLDVLEELRASRPTAFWISSSDCSHWWVFFCSSESVSVVAPCRSSARRRPASAMRCISRGADLHLDRHAVAGRSARCAATGSRSPSGSRCSP